MTDKTFTEREFYGKTIFVETCFATHADPDAKTLMVMEKDYTDFNAVLIYEEETAAITVLPRWQTTFILKDDAIYIVRETFDGR